MEMLAQTEIKIIQSPVFSSLETPGSLHGIFSHY